MGKGINIIASWLPLLNAEDKPASSVNNEEICL